MAADLDLSSAGFAVTPPRKVLDLGFAPARQSDDYRVAPDGRFLVKRPSPGTVRIIVNWPAPFTGPRAASAV